MNITEEMQLMINEAKNLSKEITKNGSYKSYYAPEIPEKIIKKLIKNFDSHLPTNSIVAYFDETVFGTTKGGFLFTNDGFYYKYIGKAMYFRYCDIERVDISTGLELHLADINVSYYNALSVLNKEALKILLEHLISIDAEYGQTTRKSTGKVKKIDLPIEKQKKCKTIIHTASTACGGVGTGLAQIPTSDNAVIVPIQITMIVSLGAVFDLNITEGIAKSIIASAGATLLGRTLSQVLVGWLPIIGNVINTATAAGVTEAIGWIAVKNFYERWLEDINKGRFEGMKDGYNEASSTYERKLRDQAQKFLNQERDFRKAVDEYEKLISDYKNYIKELQAEFVDEKVLDDIKLTYNSLLQLREEC